MPSSLDTDITCVVEFYNPQPVSRHAVLLMHEGVSLGGRVLVSWSMSWSTGGLF